MYSRNLVCYAAHTYHFCYDAFLQLVEPKVRLHAKPFEENEAENERQ